MVESLNTVKVLRKLADALKCDLCKQITEKPYNSSGCGHFFCHACLLELKESSCPTCGLQFYPTDITPDTVIMTILQEWKNISTIFNREERSNNQTSRKLHHLNKKNLSRNKINNITDYSSSSSTNKLKEEVPVKINNGFKFTVQADIHSTMDVQLNLQPNKCQKNNLNALKEQKSNRKTSIDSSKESCNKNTTKIGTEGMKTDSSTDKNTNDIVEDETSSRFIRKNETRVLKGVIKPNYDVNDDDDDINSIKLLSSSDENKSTTITKSSVFSLKRPRNCTKLAIERKTNTKLDREDIENINIETGNEKALKPNKVQSSAALSARLGRNKVGNNNNEKTCDGPLDNDAENFQDSNKGNDKKAQLDLSNITRRKDKQNRCGSIYVKKLTNDINENKYEPKYNNLTDGTDIDNIPLESSGSIDIIPNSQSPFKKDLLSKKGNSVFPPKELQVTPPNRIYPSRKDQKREHLNVNISTDNEEDFMGFMPIKAPSVPSNRGNKKDGLEIKRIKNDAKDNGSVKRKQDKTTDSDGHGNYSENSKRRKITAAPSSSRSSSPLQDKTKENSHNKKVENLTAKSTSSLQNKAKGNLDGKSLQNLKSPKTSQENKKERSLKEDKLSGNNQISSQSSDIIPATPQIVKSHSTNRRRVNGIKQRTISRKQHSDTTGSNESLMNTSISSDTSFRTIWKKDGIKRNKKGETPLQVACEKGKLDVVKSLLAEGANPNTRDYAGWTPLHEAVQQASLPIVEMLLKSGANVNTPGWANITPLLEAVLKNNFVMARFLLRNGADTNLRSRYNYRPLDCAKTSEMKKLLTQLHAPELRTETEPNFCMPEPRTLYSANLNKIQKKCLQTFCMKHDLILEDTFRSDLTHVIVETKEKNVCSANLNILRAIANGIAIISYSWIELNENSDCTPNPDAWEVHGTEDFPESEAPMKSRINEQKLLPKLFDGLHIYLAGSWSQWNGLRRSDIVDILRDAGAILLTREPDPEGIPADEATVMFHSDPDGPLGLCSHIILYVPSPKEPLLKYNMRHIKTLPLKWSLDCLQTFSIINPT